MKSMKYFGVQLREMQKGEKIIGWDGSRSSRVPFGECELRVRRVYTQRTHEKRTSPRKWDEKIYRTNPVYTRSNQHQWTKSRPICAHHCSAVQTPVQTHTHKAWLASTGRQLKLPLPLPSTCNNNNNNNK